MTASLWQPKARTDAEVNREHRPGNARFMLTPQQHVPDSEPA